MGRLGRAWQALMGRSSTQARGFNGAHLSRFISFQQTLEASHQAIRKDIAALRAHSRELAANNAYGRRYVDMCATHIVGPDGIALESEIIGNGNRPKDSWNDLIEGAWKTWGKAASIDGHLGWVDLQQLIIRTVAADGECFLKIHRGYPNDFNFSVELIDADRVDHTWNRPADALGNRTVMGIDRDKYGRPTGYHIWTAHPFDYEGHAVRELVPAHQIIHVYAEDRIASGRGIPWMTAAMNTIDMVGRLFVSELAAANLDADVLGVIKSKEDGPDINDADRVGAGEGADPVTAASQIESETASFMGLSRGLDITWRTPTHPNPNLGGFAKTLLKAIGSAVSVAYHTLSGDVSDANYSASRVALLEERDSWKKLQGWYIRSVCEPIFEAWLEMAVASGQIKLPVTDWRKLYAPTWWPRSWSWLDPEKEIRASILAIKSGLSTYQEELGTLGQNWRKVFRQRAAEQAYAKQLGLTLDLDSKLALEEAASPNTVPLDTSGGSDAAA